jgi:hypothetical protein
MSQTIIVRDEGETRIIKTKGNEDEVFGSCCVFDSYNWTCKRPSPT